MILLIPAALTSVFGRYVGNRRQGWALYGAMLAMFVVAVGGRVRRRVEPARRPSTRPAWPATRQPRGQGGPLRDPRTRRCGPPSRRSPRAARSTPRFDSLTGIGGLVPMFNMSTGEVVFGGVGSGLYGMLLFVVLAVFIAGLMVGRTPEYLGKKIEAREVKLVMIGTLFVPLLGADRHGARDRHEVGRAVDLQPRPAGLLRDALRLHLADRTTTAPPSPATPATCSRTAPTRAPSASPSPTCSAASPCWSAASCRWSPRSPWRARSRRSGCAPLGPGTFRTRHGHVRGAADRDDRDRRRPHLLPGLPARPDRARTHRPTLLMRRDLINPHWQSSSSPSCSGWPIRSPPPAWRRCCGRTRPTAA